MNEKMKTICRTLVASVIIFFIAIIVSLLIVLLINFSDILTCIFGITMLLWAGYEVGNMYKYR